MQLGRGGVGGRWLWQPIGLAPVECLVAEIRNDLEEHHVAQPAEQGVTDQRVSRTRTKSGGLHDIADEHGGDEIFATLQGTDSDLCDFLGLLRLVGFLELLGQLRLDLLLVVKSRAEDAHGEDCVNFDVGSWSINAMPLGVRSIVHLNLLAESVRQGADGSLGRRVRAVAGDRSERQSRASEDQMPPRVLHLLAWGNGDKPAAKGGICHVGGSPVDGVHLLTLDIKRHIDEESGATKASTAPDNVRSRAVVPSSDLGNHTLTFIGISEVGADVEEALLVGIGGVGLEDE